MIKRIIEEQESSSKKIVRENKRIKMTPEEKQNKKSQHATDEQTRWKKRDKIFLLMKNKAKNHNMLQMNRQDGLRKRIK